MSRTCYTAAMARSKDEQKRSAIQQTAKALFARDGFYNTSIQDIVHESGLSVGTIYNYFDNKDGIVRSIVEEGWEVFRDRLRLAVADSADTETALAVVIDRFVPKLLEDVDLITILLTEAVEHTGIETKLGELRDLIGPLIAATPAVGELSRTELETSIMVYFVGILDSARIAETTKIDITVDDIIQLLRTTIERSLNVTLPRLTAEG